MNKFSNAAFFILMTCLTGCRVGPVYHPPEIVAPPEWKHPSNGTTETACVENWWEIFNDTLLNSLEIQALENNKNLYIALDRVMEARAQVGIVEANLSPQLSLNPLYNNQDSLVKVYNFNKANPPPPPVFREHALTYALPLNLSYEVDLWGQLHDQYDSALFNFEAEQEAYMTAMLLLTSDVASTYYQIRTLDSLIELFTKTIETRKKAYNINLDRYSFKLIDYSPVALSGLDLSNVESQYYAAVQQRELQVNALALLLGVAPIDLEIDFQPLKDNPPTIPAGIPSVVLLQRPDVAQAERTMASQHALIGAAYASLFPSLTLTGALGFLSPDYKHFLQWISRYWQMGAAISQPVYDGGRIFSQIDLSWANFKEASDSYKQTVLTAFKEVEDALASLEWLVKEAESVQKSVDFAQSAYQISMVRYLSGVDFYLQVADNERQLLDNQRALVTLLQSRYIATIQLIKAMGGSW